MRNDNRISTGQRNHYRTSVLAVAAAATALMITAGSVNAQTWTGAVSSDWNTAGNWSTNTVPAGSNVTFNAPWGPTLTLSADIAFNNILFQAGASGDYTIGADASHGFSANGNAAIDFAANSGDGTITFNAPITYSGGSGRFTINGTNPSTLHLVFNGDVTFTPGTGHSLNAQNGSTNYLNGHLTKIAGSGDLSVGAGTWIMSNSNPDLQARVTVGSTLIITNKDALINAPVYVSGTLDLTGLEATVGSLTVRGGNTGLAGDTASSINSQDTVILQSGTVNTALVGSSGVVKTNVAGDPQMNFQNTLAGANTYTGVTEVRGGTINLDANKGGSLRSGAELAMGGENATFKYLGKDDEASVQTLGDVALDAEGYRSEINATGGAGTGTATLNLGDIAANTPGTTLNLTTGTRGTLTTTQENTNGILGGRILFNTNDFAVGNGAGNAITAATYTDLASSGTDVNNSQLTGGNGTTTLDGDLTTNTLKLNVSGARELNLGSHTLKLTSGGLLVSGGADTSSITNGTITTDNADLIVNTNRGLTIGAAITDNGSTPVSLTKSGGNTLTLSGANTYTGDTYVNQGTLAFGASNVLSNSGKFMIAGNSTVNMGANSDVIGQLVLDHGTINGTGTLLFLQDSVVSYGTINPQLMGPAGLTKTGSFGVTLNNTNTYSGQTTVLQGTLTYGANNATGSGDVLVDGGTLSLQGFSGQAGNVSLLSGTINSTSNAGVLTSNNAIYAESGTLGVILDGTAGLTKETTGSLSLNGVNRQTGTTVINQGTVTVAATAEIADANAPLQLNNTNTGAGNTTTLSLSNRANPYQVGSLSGSIATPSSGTNNAYINLATAAGLSVTQTEDGTFSGAIRQNGSSGGNLTLSADSTATLTLTSTANSYNGATTVLGGTLAIGGTGNINSTSGITVNGGEFKYNSPTALTKPLSIVNGTLSGSGLIRTAVAIGDGATISPGNSPGTLTINNSAHTWGAGGSYVWQLLDNSGVAGTGWDLVSVTGTGTLNITASNATPFTLVLQSLSAISPDVAGTSLNWDGQIDHSWLIAQSGTAISGFDAGSFVIDSSGFSGIWGTSTFSVSLAEDNKGIYLNYTAVPEPGSLSVLALGAMGLLARRRRRQ